MEKEVRVELWGARLKEVRNKLNVTQKGMAAVAGVSNWTISDVEKKEVGTLSEKVFNAIVNEFKINPKYLQGYESDPENMFIQVIKFNKDTEEESTTPEDIEEEVSCEDVLLEGKYEEDDISIEKVDEEFTYSSHVEEEEAIFQDMMCKLSHFVEMGPKLIYVGENADLIRDIVNELRHMTELDLEYIKAFIEFRSVYPQ